MEVSCPACAARYTADEQKLRGKTARMRCRACDTVWLVSGPEKADAKLAAVVKRGAEREHRDLFASRPVDLGSVKQTLRPGPSPAPQDVVGGTVAARNETSVLFTVASLQGGARVKTPEPELSPLSSGRVEEDDGIIDLNALSTKAGARPIAPLFSSEPPPAAFTREVSASSSGEAMVGGTKMKKRALIGIGAAAVALVLAAVGISAAFKGEEPVARTQASLAAPPPPAVTAPPPGPAPEPPPATASASSSSSDDDAQSPNVGVSGKKGRGKGGKGIKRGAAVGHTPAGMTKVKSSGVSGDTVASSKPAAPAPDKCGCKGDFSCILRCTAKGK